MKYHGGQRLRECLPAVVHAPDHTREGCGRASTTAAITRFAFLLVLHPNKMPSMALALLIFGVAFGAACVWLTVRIVNRRKKPGWRFVATVVLATASAAYPLSIGPSQWMLRQGWLNQGALSALKWFYSPLAWLGSNGPEWIGRVMFWYEQLWTG